MKHKNLRSYNFFDQLNYYGNGNYSLLGHFAACFNKKFEVAGSQFFEEKADLDKQYKQWKRPSIKTIKTKYGDIYDCVDFYKQLSFDRPLLKNHTFHPQMKPSFIPGTTSPSQGRMFRNKMRFRGEGCPEGTVPIWRMSKNDFIKQRQFTEDHASRNKSNGLRGVPGYHFAVVETNTGPSTTYKGAGGTFSLHSLPIKSSQYSFGGIIIKNGNDLIQVGWTFEKDPKDGNWWLSIEGDDYIREAVGFWPRQIFTTLTDSASYIAVGGEAYGPLSERLPPMGNGYYPVNDVELTAFCCQFTVLDADSVLIDDPQSTITSYDNWHYGVHDMGKVKFSKENDDKLGRLIFYGGTS